jgi:hypothetical protein
MTERMVGAIEQAGIQQAGDIPGGDRTIGHTATRRLDLDQHFEPVQAARTVADNGRIELAGDDLGLEGFHDAFGADGKGCGIAGDENTHCHWRTSLMRAAMVSRSRRP